MLENNSITLHFDGKKSFNDKNLTIVVFNTKGIYDVKGNRMHINKASFYIKRFVSYSKKTESTIKTIGKVIIGLFLGVALIGAGVSFVSSSVNAGSLMGTLLEFFEILQYLVFLMFLNTDIPPAPADFISVLFQNSIEIGEFLDQLIIQMNIKNFTFSFNYDLSVRLITPLTSLDPS